MLKNKLIALLVSAGMCLACAPGMADGQAFEVLTSFYPMYLLKACLAGDIEKMENLGIYEVTEEDFALCEFVDPSKIEIQQIIRDGINLMIREA